jgi:tRNA pseudouridine13 synthase
MSTPIRATIRREPSDFVVDELPAYDPSGQGDHLLVTFRKTGLDTPTAVARIADLLGSDPAAAGWAGMKDRHAVTSQTASFFCPAPEAPGRLEGASLPGIEILAAGRHPHKLKPGHLRGNRFRIILRDIDPATLPIVAERLGAMRAAGVPNHFGAQRFGRGGDNAERALAWLRGEARPPRGARKQRLLFSAVQSMLFNRVLDRRLAAGTHATVLAGDLAQKHDSGGMFLVPEAEGELADARGRAERGELSPTGPMFGAKMRWPGGIPAEIEREVLAETLGDPGLLDRHKRLGRGTRRVLRLPLGELGWEPGMTPDCLVLGFVLPKGGYATTVLGQVFEVEDPHRRDPAGEADPSQPPLEDASTSQDPDFPGSS